MGNVVERAVLLSQDGVVHGFHLPPTLQTAEASGTGAQGHAAGRPSTRWSAK